MKNLSDSRLLSLDVARGIASLCVVIFHWSLFFYVTQSGAPIETFPFYNQLAYIYENGWLGADFFFVLSGAIFFIKYSEGIAKADVTPGNFFILRFSRLAPLYYATFFLTLVIQSLLAAQFGHYIFFNDNMDGLHLAVNFLFIQNWGFTPLLSDFSINPPAWSVSIEALLYILFFLLLRYVTKGTIIYLAVALAGIWLVYSGVNVPLGRGIWCFFMSGTLAWFYTRPSRIDRYKPEVFAITGILFCVLVFRSQLGISIPSDPNRVNDQWLGYAIYTLFFSFFVSCLVFSDRILHKFAKPFAFLGDISYSSYLIQYPLLLAAISAVTFWNGTFRQEIFRSPGVLLLFFLVLISLSLLSFHFLEMPAKKALRAAHLETGEKAAQPKI
jgi:peptidoglycan/LPS O-acetylase OafA/YrhL